MYNNLQWELKADFEDYKYEFELVKDYISETVTDESGSLYVCGGLESHPYELYNSKNKQFLNCPDEIKSAIKILCTEGFPHKDSHFEYIEYDENRIAFCVNGPYALVYSPQNKPTYLASPGEDRKIVVKSLGDGWYHVAERLWF